MAPPVDDDDAQDEDATPRLTPQADSTSWLGQQGNQVNIFNEFLAQVTPAAKAQWGSLCRRQREGPLLVRIHEAFCHFITAVYIIPVGRKNAGNVGPVQGLERWFLCG